MPFKSLQQDIFIPPNITTWQWLFENPTYSPLHRYPASNLAGYHNAITKETLSYADVKVAATALSTTLVRRYGLQPTDTVSLFSQNTIWYPVAMHATLRVGGKVSGASPAYNVEEMTYALQKADAKFLMTHPESMSVAVEAAKAAGVKKENVILLEGKMEGYKNLQDLIEEGKGLKEAEVWTIPEGKTNADVCGFLSFSSGTTGLPKAVSIVVHVPPRDRRALTPTNHTCRS
jgi:4-coumarate--CoA ligase